MPARATSAVEACTCSATVAPCAPAGIDSRRRGIKREDLTPTSATTPTSAIDERAMDQI